MLSSPGPDQVCPVCKGPLRVLRTTREDRLDCTWFRLEWLEVERDHADCPRDLAVETAPLHRPAFALRQGPVGNGLLARIATWRWQDHMPGHDIARLLASLGLRCTDSHVARWLLAAGQAITPVAAAIRARCEGGATDPQGLLVVDEGKEGRLRATVRGELVSFAWTPSEEGPRPDTPEERARRVLLDARGWSRAGRQAHLRRTVARALATERDRAARACWTLEELRAAADPAAEAAALDRALAALAPGDPPDPHLLMANHLLASDGAEGLRRLRADGRLATDPPLPDNARGTLPRWFLGMGDGGVAQVADWLTVTESCASAGVSPWRHLRDLFEAWADGGWQPVDGARWVPRRKG
jgi:transposase